MAPVVFPIPAELRALIASGAWPHDHREAGLQHSRPLVPADRVRAFAPEESSIYLLPPPFMSVRDLVEGAEWSFWESDMVAPDEISFEHTVVIGDFGIGSDAPIVLDYRLDARRPAAPPSSASAGARRAGTTTGSASPRTSPGSRRASGCHRATAGINPWNGRTRAG
jgi:hypothetical protein